MLAIDPLSANPESILIKVGMIIEVAGRQSTFVSGALGIFVCKVERL
jgi:hypothetical protein